MGVERDWHNLTALQGRVCVQIQRNGTEQALRFEEFVVAVEGEQVVEVQRSGWFAQYGAVCGSGRQLCVAQGCVGGYLVEEHVDADGGERLPEIGRQIAHQWGGDLRTADVVLQQCDQGLGYRCDG